MLSYLFSPNPSQTSVYFGLMGSYYISGGKKGACFKGYLVRTDDDHIYKSYGFIQPGIDNWVISEAVGRIHNANGLGCTVVETNNMVKNTNMVAFILIFALV